MLWLFTYRCGLRCPLLLQALSQTPPRAVPPNPVRALSVLWATSISLCQSAPYSLCVSSLLPAVLICLCSVRSAPGVSAWHDTENKLCYSPETSVGATLAAGRRNMERAAATGGGPWLAQQRRCQKSGVHWEEHGHPITQKTKGKEWEKHLSFKKTIKAQHGFKRREWAGIVH